MSARPKGILFELPTADEIDGLAVTTPKFEVRKFEYDMGDEKADLKYAPCKGQLVLVIVGKHGTLLVRSSPDSHWTLPNGRVSTHEEVVASAKRIARDQGGVMIRGVELVAMYDIVWHYSDVSIKRLHLVYTAITEDDRPDPAGASSSREAEFFIDLPKSVTDDDIWCNAIADCSNK